MNKLNFVIKIFIIHFFKKLILTKIKFEEYLLNILQRR
uniref:Uncharacterized protein n=1 Tax=Myoviridae sp. ctWb16 TaxID=2827690 RepID=A0A8S5T102_9CAUD|nr:MAG TPA: hypothetical protein [Myoviridae sp. ctWb16]